MNINHSTLRLYCMAVFLFGLSACVQNKPFRNQVVESNCIWENADCSQSIIEHYPEYDLGFVEFTERGNLYNREYSNKVMSLINQEAQTERGVAVFVFVHGWKHNAADQDSNVQQFRDFLSRAAENEIVGKRKVFGLYLGWRGDFTKLPVLREATYWTRKSVAEEIGAGGATEIFSQLHQMLVQQFEESSSENELYKNSYVIIGHSFGGAIVLSAVHDVLLKDLVTANTSATEEPTQCQRIRRFADALILLNPAVEANKGILLKEAAARCVFSADQPKLMHVLSSDGDRATHLFFPLGQYLNVSSTAGPKKLVRRINGKRVILSEKELDVVTVGNLEQMRTAYLSYSSDTSQWQLRECRDSLDGCLVVGVKAQENHIPSHEYDPLSFIKTDRYFIKNHNDVFGCYVQSFITAVIFETQSLDKKGRGTDNASSQSQKIEGCDPFNFDFRSCFNNQLEDYDCEAPV